MDQNVFIAVVSQIFAQMGLFINDYVSNLNFGFNLSNEPFYTLQFHIATLITNFRLVDLWIAGYRETRIPETGSGVRFHTSGMRGIDFSLIFNHKKIIFAKIAEKNFFTVITSGHPFNHFCREISQIEYKVYCQNENSIENSNLNLVEYTLLKSIIFCYSTIPGISEKGNLLLTEHRESYASLLLKYLQTNMGAECGAKRYLEILSLIPRLAQIAADARQIYIQMALMRRKHMRLHQYALDFDEPLSELLDQLFFK
jgi:hypothetical protein